jgi:hypothetical protein
MLKTITKLYCRDRTAIPIKERYIFNLPLPLRKKQGNQQLRLWIERAKLLFDTYTEVPIRKDQQKRIMQWLQVWRENSSSPILDSTHSRKMHTEHNNDEISTDDEDDAEVRSKLSQMNISNWLKSWGNERRDSTTDAQHLSTQDNLEKSMQSNRDGRLNDHLS